MPVFTIKDKKILFIHIPKTGGSSIGKWLSEYPTAKRMLFSNHALPDMKVTPQHLSASTVKALLGEFSDSYLSFAVVRNPYDRIVSEFKYRLDLGLLHSHARPELLFNDWVIHFISRERQYPGSLDNHLRPQCYFLDDSVEVFKFEDGLSEVAKAIAAKAGLGESKLASFPKTKVSTERNAMWNKQAAKLVENYYAIDFERFGYERDYPHSPNVGNLDITGFFRRRYYFSNIENSR